MRKINPFLSMAIMAAMMEPAQRKDFFGEPESPEEKRQKQEQVYAKKGMSLYVIDGVEVWARDYKNAERKAKNINLAKGR